MAEEEDIRSLVPTQRVPDGEPSQIENDDDDKESLDYWGRLYPARKNVKFHELKKEKVSVGKTKSCDVCLGSKEVPSSIFAVVSRQHFSIFRTVYIDKFGAKTYKVQLEDHSLNGTYVNGSRVAKDETKTLSDNCVIAFGHPDNNVYYFKDPLVRANLPPVVQKKYDMGICLGSGAYGLVSLVFCKETGIGLAMKTIKPNKTQEKIETELEKLDNEIKILARITHPNVIKLVDHVDFGSEKYLLMEAMTGKDLFARIRSSKRLTEHQSKLYFYQIASGVKYLHSKGIVHRDLKPENVLLATEDEETVVKITDFGLSKIYNSSYLKSVCGTKLYVAPEVLKNKGLKKYTDQVDVWSMGVILYVCLSGQTPFSKERKGFTMEDQVKRGMYTMSHSGWENVSTPAKRIVRRMMTVNPERRIRINEIFDDEWLDDPPVLMIIKDLIPELDVSPQNKAEKEPVKSPPRKRKRLK